MTLSLVLGGWAALSALTTLGMAVVCRAGHLEDRQLGYVVS